MQRYAHLPKPVSRTLDACPKASSQASLTELLQRRSSDYPPFQPAFPSSSVVQAMSVQKEPTLGRLFAVSDDRQMITGMNTPNHELYVDSQNLIDEMNRFAERSKLYFRSVSKCNLFDKPYYSVQAGFKDKEKVQVENRKFWQPKMKDVNLDSTYWKRVAPQILAFRYEKKRAVQQELGACLTEQEYLSLKWNIKDLTSVVELFKKLVIYDQATEDYHDVVNPMDRYLAFVERAEDLVYTKEATTATMEAKWVALTNASELLERITDSNPFLQEQLLLVMDLARKVVECIPPDKTIDLFLLHRDNTEEEMIRSIKQDEPMFYRACDVMAATLMGNTIDATNKEQLKIYSADGTGAFHYAAKVLQSGNDWVTLESFAAGERETEMFGIEEDELEKNLDNSWNYLMYGSFRKKHDDFLSPDDNYFELYTKLRYYLKGITRIGRMNLSRRDKTNSVVPVGAFTDLAPGFTYDRSKAIWERLRFNQILNEEGRVLKESFLVSDHIGLRLSDRDRPYAELICNRIRYYYRQPSEMAFIQGVYNNEMRNIIGWMRFLKLDVDTEQLSNDFLEKLPEVPSQQLHDEGWAKLMRLL